jgi:manganese-dependent ADP-ribose/CDP-alcohol diphosphatase
LCRRTATMAVATTIGVIADIQYRNDRDDYEIPGYGQVRSYKSALPKAALAVDKFTSRGVSALWHLGDIIDGRSAEDSDAQREASMPAVRKELDEVLKIFGAFSRPVLHVVGNHCLYVERDELTRLLGLDKSAYYVRDLAPQWRAIVLDTLDVGFNRPKGSSLRKQAERYIFEREGEENALPWNGGCGADQLDWLEGVLKQARTDAVNVIVGGHHPCAPESAASMHMMFDAKIVTDMLKKYNDVVRAYFAGHYHSGGYAKLDSVHHVTFNSILDSDETNSYAFVHLYPDKIEIEGVGTRGTPSRTLTF